MTLSEKSVSNHLDKEGSHELKARVKSENTRIRRKESILR